MTHREDMEDGVEREIHESKALECRRLRQATLKGMAFSAQFTTEESTEA